MKKLFLLPAVLLSVAAGAAETKPAAAGPNPTVAFCPSAATIANKAEACENNDHFIDAGEDCLDKLDAAITAETKRMESNLTKDKGAKQKANFAASGKDYAASSVALAALLVKAEIAIKEIGTYSETLILPEDAEEEDVNEGDLAKYLNQIPCYGEAKRSLQGIEQDFKKRAGELRAAKAVADQNLASSASRADALSGDGSAAPAPAPSAPAPGRGIVPTINGKDHRGESGISGRKEPAKK